MMLDKIGLGLPRDSKGREADESRSAEDWDTWKNEMEEKYPIRYFLNQEFKAMFVWPITHRIQRVQEWVQYRTTRRYHIVNTGMTPGYSDVPERMLHVNFNMLKDFVEIEKAHMYEVFVNNGVTGNAAGVAHLMWEMGLEEQEEFGNNQQAKNAREIYELYDWWVGERPFRVDPMETTEYNAYWKLRTELYGIGCVGCSDKDTPELKKLQTKAYKLSDKLDKQYAKEDEKNLIRLIKIREALWT
jgi:hypothetical protein